MPKKQENVQEPMDLNKRIQNYKDKLRKNIEFIKTYIPEFEMTEEEINAQVTPERIKLHDELLKVYENKKKAGKISQQPGISFPHSFEREINNLIDTSGTKEAEEKNKELLQNIGNPSKRMTKYRQKMLVGMLNDVAKLDPKKAQDDVSQEEKLQYYVEHYNTFGQAVILASYTMTDEHLMDIGLKVRKEMKEQINLLYDFGQVMNKKITNLAEVAKTDLFLTFPIDKIDQMQAAKLIPYGNAQMKDQLGKIMVYAANRDNKEAVPPIPKDMVFSEETVFEEIDMPYGDIDLNNIKEVKKAFEDCCNELKKAGKPQNIGESYQKLLDQFADTEKLLSSAEYINEDGVIVGDSDDLFQTLNLLQKNGSTYFLEARRLQDLSQDQKAVMESLKKMIQLIQNLHCKDGEEENFDKMIEYMNRYAFSEKQKEPVESEVEKKIKAYDNIAAQADRIRADVEKMPEGLEKEIRSIALDARDDLVNMAGRSDEWVDPAEPENKLENKPDMSKVQLCVAKILLGDVLTDQLKVDSAETFLSFAKSLANKPVFQEAVKDVKFSDIPGLLSKDSLIKLKDKVMEMKRDHENHNKMENGRQEEIKQPEVTQPGLGLAGLK